MTCALKWQLAAPGWVSPAWMLLSMDCSSVEGEEVLLVEES